MNMTLFVGALFGAISILMAAYLDHAAGAALSNKSLIALLTAIRYQQLYAIVIVALGIVLSLQIDKKLKRWLRISSYLFIIGILLFSFGIYLSMVISPSVLIVVPVGGIVLIIGWLALLPAAFIKRD